LIPKKKNFLNIQFLLLLEFAAYKKNILLFHSVIVQNISVPSKTKTKEKRENKKKFRSKRRLLDSAVEN